VKGYVVDGYEGGEAGDCALELLHCAVVLFLPDELHIPACKVDERAGDS